MCYCIEDLFKEAQATVVYIPIYYYQEKSPIVSDKRIKGVSLTGSEAAGASLAAEAGKNLKSQF
jgi:succinate-semialdehyde dehydrogenase/glutarate-semialdehyde dehydrogenase